MEDTISQLLTQLSFSGNEIKILLELYRNSSPQKADVLSENTGVPLTRTYEALDTLVQRRFIAVLPGRPRLYRPEPPAKAVANFLSLQEKDYQDKRAQTKRITQELLDYVQNLYLKHNTIIEPDDLLVHFTDLQEAEHKTIELISQATSEILIFTHIFQWYVKIETYLLQAMERGCTVKVLMHTDPVEQSDDLIPIDVDQLRSHGIEVKKIDHRIRTRGTIVDKKAVLFVIWAQGEAGDRRVFRPQYSANPGIVEVFLGFFTHLWS